MNRVLPAEMSSFVGRAREQSDLRRLLAHRRLVTVTGGVGVGKSRLALRVAGRVRRLFPDGTHQVDLAREPDPGELVHRIADEVGAAGADLEDVVRALAGRRVLIVLDNADAVVEACAWLVPRLLAEVPGLGVLVTSRQVVGVAGEQIVRVLPLPVPDVCDLDAARRLDAVLLLVDRASADDHEFAVTEDNWRRIVRLCRRLDGTPLFIELAAGWLRTLPLDDLAERIAGEGTRVLVRRHHWPNVRHRSADAAVAWSAALCTGAEAALLARLAVFTGSFGIVDVDAVADTGNTGYLDALAGLVDRSLLHAVHHRHGVRYWMQGAVREYALRALAASGVEDEVRRAHLEHFGNAAVAAEAVWLAGERQADAVRYLRDHFPDFQLALEYALGHSARHDAAVRLAAALYPLWLHCGEAAEGLHWLSQTLTVRTSRPERAKALWVAAHVALLHGDRETAAVLAADGLAIATTNDSIAAALLVQSCLTSGEAAKSLREKAIKLGPNPLVAVFASVWSSLTALTTGDLALTGELTGEALRASRDRGDHWGAIYLGYAHGFAAWRAGDLDGADSAVAAGVEAAVAVGDLAGFAFLLELAALVAASRQQLDKAATLLGAASCTWARTSAKSLLGSQVLLRHHERWVDALSGQLPRAGQAWRCVAGTSTLAEFASRVLGVGAAAPGTTSLPAQRMPRPTLTARECLVADLLRDGLSDDIIATQLRITRRAAQLHVQRTLSKLGLTSRAELTGGAAD